MAPGEDRRPVWVYVDGVFDLFHAGHIAFLRQARALGDHLVAGVHSDDEVATYKPRPILGFHERLAMVESCRLVDRVVPFPVPLHVTAAALDSYGADFAVHGDDVSPEHMAFWYGDLVAAGRIRIVPYTAGIASREIVGRIADRLRDGSLRIRL